MTAGTGDVWSTFENILVDDWMVCCRCRSQHTGQRRWSAMTANCNAISCDASGRIDMPLHPDSFLVTVDTGICISVLTVRDDGIRQTTQRKRDRDHPKQWASFTQLNDNQTRTQRTINNNKLSLLERRWQKPKWARERESEWGREQKSNPKTFWKNSYYSFGYLYLRMLHAIRMFILSRMGWIDATRSLWISIKVHAFAFLKGAATTTTEKKRPN